ncbi:MYB family protein [Blastocystis sp. subtype 4]|uniref:MYB family protein n=1 Tax=Blastocystis sp. subtype 4 TaxID=944170 RepID=UPI000711A51C|nr:MYB family protein [Blastocystis sp. subtype 4]KNB45041.1 MYB family protein [Blastocystis sp. subtype 4]|eukprot:XP_014528483.1 MYB family protein [Blastocystis sp. subtype 4]
MDDSSFSESETCSEGEDDIILGGISKEQRLLVIKRLEEYQQQFRSFNKNQEGQKVRDVLNRIKDIDEKTAKLAIESCRNNELLAIKRLMDDPDYKDTVTKMAHNEIEVDMDAILYRDRIQELREALRDDGESDRDNDDEGDDWDQCGRYYSRNDDDDESDHSHSSRKRHHEDDKSDRKHPRLNLDDALIMLASLQNKEESSQSSDTTGKKSDESNTESDTLEIPVAGKAATKVSLQKEADLFRALSGSEANKIPAATLRQLGWSEARIKAFRNREKNPNQYYYRFNDPGEPQATGKWSPKDKALFLKLVAKGVDYQWGIFSMNIPGRVGYQCSNYYRQLIKEGVIHDDNYVFDNSGKLVFKFRDSEGHSTLAHTKKKNVEVNTKSKKKSRSLKSGQLETEIETVEEVPLLPDYIDPMTMMPVVKPTISPYGHVLGYDSWIKVLNRDPRNTCPFTKKVRVEDQTYA